MTYVRNIVRALYKKLLALYPCGFREQLGESMQQTFNDLCRERQIEDGWFGFVSWMFVETAVGIVREHVLLITEGDIMKNMLAIPRSAALISSILLAVAFIVAPLIYLVGNLRDAMGPFAYAVADFLYGPAGLPAWSRWSSHSVSALASARRAACHWRCWLQSSQPEP